MDPITSMPAGNGFRLAKIVKSHPSGQAHDIVFLDDFSRAAGVQSIATHASNNAGTVDMHRPDTDSANPWNPELQSVHDQTKRDIVAVVGFMGVTPIIMGHLPPALAQLNFPDSDRWANLHIERHASDLVQSTDDKANFSLRHPSGAFITISTNGMPPDFSGQDFDHLFKLTRNKTEAPIIRIENGHSTITMLADGTIEITADNLVKITAGLIALN